MMDHAPSWYAATANPAPDRPSLAGTVRCDAVVVGGGFTGLTTALTLAERGFDVVLLEARRIGWGASGRNGGQIVTGHNKDMATIAGLVGKEDAARLWQMGEDAKDLIRDRVARHAIACDLKWGYLLAALKTRQQRDLAATLAEWRDRCGYHQARLVDRDEIRTLVDSPLYVGGLLDSGGGQLHPLNYALGLADAAAAAGVRLFEGSEVTRLEVGPTIAAITSKGRVEARFGALAGNAYLPGLSPDVERLVRPRIMPVATSVVATEPLSEALARRILPADIAVADVNFVLNYYRLSPDRRMLFGGRVSYSTFERAGLQRSIQRTMVRTLPALDGVPVTHCWGGHVGITINRLPHLGKLSPNLFFAQGFSGHGVALTGIAGTVMAEAIAGTAERFDVFARIPHRPFPGGRLLRMPALVLAMAWYRLRDLL